MMQPGFEKDNPPTSSATSARMRRHWSLDPRITFLNHGSYGACPNSVLELQTELRSRLERSPVHFMSCQYPKLLALAREELADFLGAEPERIAFVTNATTGVNAVLRSLEWQPGDEILVTDHGYGACRNVASYLAASRGVRVVEVEIPFPDFSPDDFVEAVASRVTPATRLALIDHVTSPTALIFPIEKLAPALAERGVPLLVDGAHAPGMLDLELDGLGQLGVTYYTGNLHKWCCSPKGAAFLWVAQAHQPGLHPPIISHGFSSTRSRSKFLEEFDWCGSFDPTAWLAAPRALRFLEALYPDGWPGLRSRCQTMLLAGREALLADLPSQALAPISMLGQIASFRIGHQDPEKLYWQLYDDFALDTQIMAWKDETMLRISAAPYNEIADYQALSEALRAITP